MIVLAVDIDVVVVVVDGVAVINLYVSVNTMVKKMKNVVWKREGRSMRRRAGGLYSVSQLSWRIVDGSRTMRQDIRAI